MAVFFAVAGISITPTHVYTSLWRKFIPFVLSKNIRGVSLVPYNKLTNVINQNISGLFLFWESFFSSEVKGASKQKKKSLPHLLHLYMPAFRIKNLPASATKNGAGNLFSPGLPIPFFSAKAGNNAIQRQPTPQVPAKPNLSSISAKDPASSKSHPSLINAALANSSYAKYFIKKLSGTGSIDAKGKFVIEMSKQNFVNAYNKCYGTNVSTLSSTDGFYCPATQEIHLVPNAEFGMAFHESVHKVSALPKAISYGAWANEANFAFDLNEGLTSHYAKEILDKDYGITNYIDGYPTQRKKAEGLIQTFGKDEIAKFYFAYDVTGLLSKTEMNHHGRNIGEFLVSKLKQAW